MLYGNKIETIRDRLGVTQKSMADELNISDSLYSRYEKEIQIIPLKHLNTVCNIFDISFDYTFSFSDKKQYDNSKKEIDKIKSGARLKEFRKENNITQEKLASILNTTHSVIADYERGRYLIATPFLYDICKKFNVSADYLLGKVDYPMFLKIKHQ